MLLIIIVGIIVVTLSNLQNSHNSLGHYTEVLEALCLELDTNSRRKHLILTGIPESKSEKSVGNENNDENSTVETPMEESTFDPCHAVAFETLSSIMDTLTQEDIDVAYRMGRKGTQPRPILIKFARESVRNEVNKRRFQLKEVDATKSAYLNPDLPPKLNHQRSELRSVVNLAKSKQVAAKFQGNRITVDNKVYRHDELDKLPSGLTLSDAFQVKTPKGIAFSGHNVFLSNFYPVKVVFENENFISSEQAYQHCRANFFGDTKTADKIKCARSPQEAKKFGSKSQVSKQWDAVKVNKMREIVYSKFGQNHRLQDLLLGTGTETLIEATHDRFWGCGYTIRSDKVRNGQWNGKNQLGLILMDCREEIRKHRAAQIALHKSMADQHVLQSQGMPSQVQASVLPDPTQPPPLLGQPPMANYVHQSQVQMPINQFVPSQVGFQQPNTGYRFPIATNAMQLAQPMLQSLMSGMIPTGFPTPTPSASQYYGYPIPSQQPSIPSTTPSPGGFVQGERRTSFDPGWSPTFIS